MSSLLCVRKVYQMTVITVILVGLVTLIIVLAIQGSANETTVCKVQNPTVTIDDGTITVQWVAVQCAGRIEITHYVNDEFHNNHVFPGPWHMAIVEKVACSHNNIIITAIPLNENTHSAGTESISFDIGFFGESKVQNLKFNPTTRRFEWEGPQELEHCDVQYIVEFTNGDPSDDTSTKITNEYFEPQIHSCTNNHLTVATWVGYLQKETASESTSFEEPAPGDGVVQNLHFNPVSRLIEWQAPENYDRCQLMYLVSFSNGEDEATIETTAGYQEFHLYPCTNNDVTVQTVIGFEDGRVGGIASTSFTEPAPGDGEVQNLYFNPTSRRLEWQAPLNYDRCQLLFLVRHSDGADEATIETTAEYQELHLYPCTNNDVTVQTVIGFEGGREGGIASTSFTEPAPGDGEVQNLEFNPTSRRLEWQAPLNYDRCQLLFLVRFSDGEDEATIETTAEYQELPLYPCTNNDVTVQTVIGFEGGREGGIASASFTEPAPGDGVVQNLEFNPTSRRLEWKAPLNYDRCQLLFLVRFSDGEDEATIETTAEYQELHLYPCTNNDVTVQTVIGFEGGREGGIASTSFTEPAPGDGVVQNLEFNPTSRRLEWKAPLNYDRCQLLFLVRFSDGEDEATIETTAEYQELHLYPCTNNDVTVQTVIGFEGGREGGIASTSFTEPAPGDGVVQNLEFNPTSRRLEWKAPLNYDRCQLLFLVRFSDGEDEATIETTAEYQELHLYPCTNNDVTVQTVIGFEGGREGGIASTSFTEPAPGDGEVQNLHFSPVSRRFEWQAPENYDRCQLLYLVRFYNIDVDFEIRTKTEYFEFNLYSCTTNFITVQTLIGFEGERVGATQNAQHYEPVPAVLEVSNLGFNVDNSRFEWEAPENSRLCVVDYEVVFQNEIETIERTISEQYFAVDPLPCSNNHISVITVIETYRSSEKEARYIELIERPYPEHLSTNPQSNSVNVEWHIDQEAPGCEIETLKFMIGVQGDNQMENHYVDFIESEEEVTATLDGLEPDKLYEYTLCFVFTIGIDEPQCGDTILLRTIPLTPPDLELTLISSKAFDIVWHQGYDPKFVKGHTLTITPLSPLHFLPDICEEEWRANVVEEFFTPDVYEYHFDYGLPSFKYSVVVTTEFTSLGMRTTGSEEIETKEGKPGQLTATTSFDFVPSAPYNVALKTQWGVPCDINGHIKRFDYELTGTPKAHVVGICGETKFSPGVIYVDDPDSHPEQFLLEVPGLLPFFEYSLEIKTTLREDNADVTLVNIEDVPQPHNPPN